jgi:hypothetical protein
VVKSKENTLSKATFLRKNPKSVKQKLTQAGLVHKSDEVKYQIAVVNEKFHAVIS